MAMHALINYALKNHWRDCHTSRSDRVQATTAHICFAMIAMPPCGAQEDSSETLLSATLTCLLATHGPP